MKDPARERGITTQPIDQYLGQIALNLVILTKIVQRKDVIDNQAHQAVGMDPGASHPTIRGQTDGPTQEIQL